MNHWFVHRLSEVWSMRYFLAMLNREDIGNRWTVFFFAEQKKYKKNGAAGKKKFRARCKNLAFYTTESLNEPFFASKK